MPEELISPCKSGNVFKTARKGKDMQECILRLKALGYSVAAALPDLALLKKGEVEVTVYSSGKILIKADKETATEIAKMLA